MRNICFILSQNEATTEMNTGSGCFISLEKGKKRCFQRHRPRSIISFLSKGKCHGKGNWDVPSDLSHKLETLERSVYFISLILAGNNTRMLRRFLSTILLLLHPHKDLVLSCTSSHHWPGKHIHLGYPQAQQLSHS